MKYLIQFSQQHESFWLPELDSLLELNGIDPGAVYDHDMAWTVVSKGHKVRYNSSSSTVVEQYSRSSIEPTAVRRSVVVCCGGGTAGSPPTLLWHGGVSSKSTGSEAVQVSWR